ncbi:stage II sporulation protein P [Tannockella kyphosi]|uniref:stage II sporulation protein P n=1 Tax=Tannockella kyphosi TaxID=2899121 RepID=UPI0020135E24|nr:stage II sporulation protein P [Tannockella kyphosi]
MNKTKFQIMIKSILVCCILYQLPVFESDSMSSMEVVTTTNESKGSIYIYNTHQGEEYEGFDVMLGADLLQSNLQALGYQCNREQTSIEDYLYLNSMDYSQCYTVSQMYLEEELEEYGEYDLIIDFHRDAISKELSTITYENKDYAKIMFVVGKSSGNYELVSEISQLLSDYAEDLVPDISRGIMEKESDYNQGVSENIVLIEVGAYQNTKEEVENTIEVLTQVINRYMEENETTTN